MTRPPSAMGLLVFLFAACGDDGGAGSGATGTDGTGASGTTAGSTAAGSTTAGSTTSTTSGGSSTGTTGTSGTAGTTAGTSGTATGGTTGDPVCAMLPEGPIDPEVVTMVFDGSEDIAFDGLGHIAGKQGNQLVLVDAAENVSPLTNMPGQTLGLRYLPGGDLVVAHAQQGRLVRVEPSGASTTLLMGLDGPNGVYADFDGNVWFTEIGGDRVSVLRPDDTVEVVVEGPEAAAANGVVYDPDRGLVFYDNYFTGRVAKVTVDGGTFGTPEEVGTIDGRADGMVLDACGNLYVVDQGDGELYRFFLDANGDAVGGPELLATFPQNVANAQFGRGDGFDETTLYVAGMPGVVYAVPVGVTGQPIPM
ncbi:MAG: gluconolactonase [Deltaproteobacteria bacterium]|nr:MAG: gluconolactonase [Deltaproteobacteria bacterium]